MIINTLSVSGKDQALDLSDLHSKLASVKTIDLAGSGDNRLTLSADDVLALGEASRFVDDGKKQIQIKGDAGDSATLVRQLENVDRSEWVAEDGRITSAGVEYTVWHHPHPDADVLIQVGIRTEFD